MHDSIEVAKSMWIQGCKTVKVQVSQIHADSDKIWENLVCWVIFKKGGGLGMCSTEHQPLVFHIFQAIKNILSNHRTFYE